MQNLFSFREKKIFSLALKKSLSLLLSVGCLFSQGGLLAFSASTGTITGDIRVTVNPTNIKANLPIPGGQQLVTMSFHGISIQDALRALAQKGGFNVLIDESVAGEISVDLNNVTIQDALESIKSYGNLVYAIQGNNLTVAHATSPKGQSLKKAATRIFALKNANASQVASILNNTLFSDALNGGATGAVGGGGAGGATAMPVTADFHTNSIIVVGQPQDIQAVEKHLAILDQPRQSRTWRLSHANALDVATILSSSLFNEGVPVLGANGTGSSGGAGGAGGTGSVGQTPAQVRVVADNVQEGQGTNQSSQSGGNSGGQTSLTNTINLRTRVKAVQTISVAPNGPVILPDTRLNTLTLMGTAEQIAMVEAMIPMLDRKIPQVVLETALIELSETGIRELGFNFGVNVGGFKVGSNNTSTNNGRGSAIGVGTSTETPRESLLQFTTSPTRRMKDFYYQINALVNQNKARMLANPSIVTASNDEAVVSIVDEIIRSVEITQSALSAPTATVNIGEAGIVLNMLPVVGADNTVSLKIRPVISTVAETKTGLSGTTITLLSKREVLTQNVRLQDGETFVLGGLVQNTNKEAVYRTPGLSNLPIVGALARNSTLNKKRTELVVLVTPHILREEGDSPNSNNGFASGGQLNPNNAGRNGDDPGMVPVSLQGRGHSNALPAMEPARTINSTTNGVDPLDYRRKSQPSPRPSGALLPDELKPAPAAASTPSSKSSGAMVPVSYQPAQSSTVYKPSRTPPATVRRSTPSHPVVEAPGPVDTSDAAIQAILEKFR
ncbi:secretin N-terminal domain-containing protein [Vampirovibrio chlorellavorus]|uniref:secretin N-terminal domain-containing protein n=1 Tax=Vampirovibrio chlorellavorus TaxID=758823 RepID=UPI0026EC4308|nr:secretin N-terminal domain-containing protein [Vampirovibrio chlorellavorus]